MRKAIGPAIFFVLFLLSAFIWLARPINRRPILKTRFYNSTIKSLDTLQANLNIPKTKIKCGWSRQNIIPEFITPMAGYQPRDRYETVHDSLFVSCILIDNGNATIALISFDLLIVPPLLKNLIENDIKNKSVPIHFAYYSASHTHNGVGGWDDSSGGQLITGSYNEKVVNYLHQATKNALITASEQLEPCQVFYREILADEFVKNRLNENSSKDGYLKGIEFKTESEKSAILTTFSAHATNINSKSRDISNDYPGLLCRKLEREKYDFAMYMAGTVGSHGVSYQGEGFDFIDTYTDDLARKILDNNSGKKIGDSVLVDFKIIPVKLGASQLRLSDNLRLSSYLFNNIFSPLDGSIRYLRIGDLVLLGMPCDFSGEICIDHKLYELANQKNRELVITSFNGQYIGYITEDHHYNESHRSEVRNMNWVGPNYGAYYSDVIKKLIQKF